MMKRDNDEQAIKGDQALSERSWEKGFSKSRPAKLEIMDDDVDSGVNPSVWDACR